MKIWRNNYLEDSSDQFLTPEGWARGEGIFETIKTVNQIPYALSRHMRRATKSARSIGIPMPSEESVRSAVDEILKAEPFERGRLRLTFASDGTFLATHEEYVESTEPLKVRSIDETGLASDGHKRFPYTHRLNILDLARREGYDEVIFIDKDGFVTEGAVSNLAFYIGGNWVTSPLSKAILPGVMRALAIEKLDMKVASISRSDIARAESALVLSSLKIAHPVSYVDGVQLKSLDKAERFAEEMQQMLAQISVG